MRVGHRIRGVMRQWNGHDIRAHAKVGGSELTELLCNGLPGVPVGAGLPWRSDRRVEGVHERVHVGGVQVVLLVPRGSRQDHVREDRRARLAEVDGHEQVELSVGCLVAPLHVDRALGLGGLRGPQRGVGTEQVLEEVLVALAGGAEQVGPPDRQDARVVLRRVRILTRELELAGLELVDDVLTNGLARGRSVVAEAEWVAVERGVRRHPAHPRALGDHVRRGLSGELSLAGGGGQGVRTELVVAELVGVQVPVRRLDHVARRTVPVERVGDLGVAGQRPHLLLADIVRPAATVDALATGQVGQREERTVDRVGVEPVIGAGAHHDHRATPGLLGVLGELAPDPRRGAGRHARDRLLPGRGVRRVHVVVRRGPLARKARSIHGPANAVLGKQQVEHRGHEVPADAAHRHSARKVGRCTVCGVEAGQPHQHRLLRRVEQGEGRVDVSELEVPLTDSRLAVPVTERAVRHHRFAGAAVDEHGLERGVLDHLRDQGGPMQSGTCPR